MSDTGFKGLIVGLGNPGPQYRNTPHNFGYLALEALLEHPRGSWSPIASPVSRCDLWRGGLNGEKWLAARPSTYMNLSGEAVGPLARWYRLAAEQILVIQDELDLPMGTLRFKQGGGAAGHKGILSIAACLGSPSFFRLRIGIGRPDHGMDPALFVLRKFSDSDLLGLPRILSSAADAVVNFCLQGPTSAMQSLHSPQDPWDGQGRP